MRDCHAFLPSLLGPTALPHLSAPGLAGCEEGSALKAGTCFSEHTAATATAASVQRLLWMKSTPPGIKRSLSIAEIQLLCSTVALQKMMVFS